MKSALLIIGALGAGLVACSQDASRHAASKECAACHMPEFESVTHPIHPGAKPTTCAVCHTQDAGEPPVLRHEWPLTGAHAKADCFSCHRGTPPVFHGTPNACVDCHRSDAAKVTFALKNVHRKSLMLQRFSCLRVDMLAEFGNRRPR